jgi:hypothetical protein
VGNGGGDECGEEGRAPRPFIGSEGKRGGSTRKGIGWPVVAASMPAIRLDGEGKQRGEWGVKRGESAAPFLGEEGSLGRLQRAREVKRGLVGLPEEEDSRSADRAGPPVSEGEAAGQAGPEGGGREVGCG